MKRILATLTLLLSAVFGFAQQLDIRATSQASTDPTVTIYRWVEQGGGLRLTTKTMPAKTEADMAAIYAQRGFATINLEKLSDTELTALAQAELTQAQLDNRHGIAAKVPPGAFYVTGVRSLSKLKSHTERIDLRNYNPRPSTRAEENVTLVPHTVKTVGWMIFRRANGTSYYRFGPVDSREPLLGVGRFDPTSGQAVPRFYTEVYHKAAGDGRAIEEQLDFSRVVWAFRCKNLFPTIALARTAREVEVAVPPVTRVERIQRTLIESRHTQVTTVERLTAQVQVPKCDPVIFIAYNGWSHQNAVTKVNYDLVNVAFWSFGGLGKLVQEVCDDGWTFSWDDLPGDVGDTGPNPWLGGDVEWGPPPPR